MMPDRDDPDDLEARLRSLPWPPKDWTDAAGWETYWTATIADRKWLGRHVYTPMSSLWVAGLVDRLRERGRKRLLFVGNGLSVAPWAFAHAGYECVALDISSAVAEFFARNEMTDARVQRAFDLRARRYASAFEQCRRAGGSVEVVCGDLFDAGAATGPFDAVFSEASLQGFSAIELPVAVSAIAGRLVPHGEGHVLVVNSEAALARIVAAFVGLGFHHIDRRAIEIPSDRRLLFSGLGSG
jgi:Thiopurine S-methyltransferase (TPMT)